MTTILDKNDKDITESVSPRRRKRALIVRIAESVGVNRSDIIAHKIYGDDVVVVTSAGKKVRAKLKQD